MNINKEIDDKQQQPKLIQMPIKKDIIPNQILSFIKLISNFMHQYTNLPPWKEIPSLDQLSIRSTLSTIKKKLEITLAILTKQASRESHKEIEHILQFTHKLFQTDPELLSKVIKLNLLINSGISLTKLISKEQLKEEKEKIMLDYLQSIIKNFYLAYGHTGIRKLETIGNQLALFVHNETFFDYEYFFLYEDEYISKEYIPKVKLQTRKLIISFNEDLITEFELGMIDYFNAHSIDYYSKFLDELKNFKEYKSNHSKEEYEQYKRDIKIRLGSPIA